MQLVADLWDSIAQDPQALPVTNAQRAELDRRLDTYEQDGNHGRDATTVLNEILQKL